MLRTLSLCCGAVLVVAGTTPSDPPPPPLLRRLDSNAPGTSNSTVNTAKQFSQNALKFLTNLRGGTTEFYQHLITTVQIQMCDQKVNSDGHAAAAEANQLFTGADTELKPYYRFVLPTSTYALKDEASNCVQVANPQGIVATMYGNGYCEVMPNCYWADIDATALTDRAPIYSTLQTVQPPTGVYRLADAKAFLTTYAKGFGATVVPSLILLVLSVLSIILFIICRCCCNKCGGRSGKPGGYDCMQKFLPILFYLIFAIAILVMAALSYVYYNIITTSVGNIFKDIQSFIDQTTAWIATLLAPLVHIGDNVVSSSNTITTQLNGSGFIETGLTGITDKLTAFSQQTANVALPRGCVMGTDAICIPCQVCTNINSQVNSVNTAISTAAGPGVASLQTTRSQISTLLLGSSNTIKGVVENAVSAQSSLDSTLQNLTQPVRDIQKTWNSNTAATQYGIVVLFALSIVVLALGLLGILFGLTPLRVLVVVMHLAYIIGFISIIITFLLSAVFIAVSVLLGDVCQVSYVIQSNWTIALGSTGKIVDTCFKPNATLVDALNLTSKFAFATGINFPTINLATMLNFAAFDSFSSTIGGTTTSTFTFDPSMIQSGVTALNTETGLNQSPCVVPDGHYTVANIQTPWKDNGTPLAPPNAVTYIKDRYTPFDNSCNAVAGLHCMPTVPQCHFSNFVDEIWHNVSAFSKVQSQSGQFITDMTTSMSSLQTYVTTWKANITRLTNTLTGIGDDLKGSLINDVDLIESRMTCAFVGDVYNELSNEFCGNMVPSFLMISIFLFLMGVFLIPVNITLIIMVKRLRHKYTSGADEETKFK
ncbi:Aste57867_18823 [Aphanomyces stellatus]|uniref:Aste57867_18823 protein n=1 Tax=Aphanomyces stellatus TaxID=120398 RepID=A0A485LBY9_9STRA|nr:hypothetical protein As57867_018759 [Aphanomyces stellatus]VFT95557.1 Aste57867_18823 [Aphanomyces stellatus]